MTRAYVGPDWHDICIYGGGRASCLRHRQVHDDHLSHAGYRTVEAAEALDES